MEPNERYKERGYVRLWRGFQDDPLYKKKRKFSQWEAWSHLYMEASGIDRIVEFHRASVSLKRGQLVETYRDLAKRWGWTLGSVQNFLRKLIRRGSIDIDAYHRSRRFITITLKKYEELNPLERKI